ncbi:RNA polymerase II holoenzyme cyclin-like subunit [Emmonsiellopsis sp. PD_5]|nr:RNA polymerase II holoenzyme cyclin-like subunit [Emmonsiellopsis sp. PD_5]
MAANYWASSQRRHWLFERDRLLEVRKHLEEGEKQVIQQYPLPDLRCISIYINQQLMKLGKRMTTRQQALATAQVYIRRFYTKVEIRRTNPYLVLTTAFYLACKMEECPQHIRFVVSEAKGLWPEYIISDVSKLGECEFWLISEMSSQLIVHHPYRTISELQTSLSLTPDEISLAWSIINDHYLTDLPLLQPPHVIAVMAILIAVVFRSSPALRDGGEGYSSDPSRAFSAFRDKGAFLARLIETSEATVPARVNKIIDWLATSEVDIEAVVDCTQELASLYEVWDRYNEKACGDQIKKYVKERGLDR